VNGVTSAHPGANANEKPGVKRYAPGTVPCGYAVSNMEQAARTHGPEAIDLWRRVDAALAADAPTVPLLNWSTTSVTAERVGNYQAHPLRGPLLEQLWVK
jgi:ABC-type transport system substrate-binding protein